MPDVSYRQYFHKIYGSRAMIPIMENQVEEKMEYELEPKGKLGII